jgi:hypothetical protein
MQKLIALISHGREIKAIFPVIYTEDRLKVLKGYQGMNGKSRKFTGRVVSHCNPP